MLTVSQQLENLFVVAWWRPGATAAAAGVAVAKHDSGLRQMFHSTAFGLQQILPP